ncbi:E3 CR1-beta [Human mastadenovirus B]|uniref:E3 CR1-beta n=1 Tax=Human mastadenovirus B TaxID=108098 RepID=T1UIT7_9ADEN|nr:E3 CR1-beta [Human mastadenovirus B]
MASVTALIIASIVTVAHGQTIVHITLGHNHTLVGPPITSEVIWTKLGSVDYFDIICNKTKPIFVICNRQNLTLINVSKIYNGYYYGYDRSSSQYKNYLVRITQPKSTVPTMTIIKMANKALENFTSPTTPNEKNIPNSMIAIIAAVALGMALIIICMFLYACCYKKFQHKQDPLLNFNI